MSFPSWFQTARVRRGLAASAILLCAGGLVLVRAKAGASPPLGGPADPTSTPEVSTPAPTPIPGTITATSWPFQGSGLSGNFAISQSRILTGRASRFFAELEVRGHARQGERAPLSLVVVLDTSGSMLEQRSRGEETKMDEAKAAVARLVRDMRDDDEIAVVRYSTDATVLQPLARVGSVRASLLDRIDSIVADGGTNIPEGLRQGLEAIAQAQPGRVRRAVLVSDGLDGGQSASEQIARDAFSNRNITVSSLGVGLDFDEAYMSSVSQVGRGNFAFVQDGAALAKFLKRELVETATTVVEDTTLRIRLPENVRLVSAIGAEVDGAPNGVEPTIGWGPENQPACDGCKGGRGGPFATGEVVLRVGSLFANDTRRVILELEGDFDANTAQALRADVSFQVLGGARHQVSAGPLTIAGTNDADLARASRDLKVLADATSALASRRQIEAAHAYSRGDGSGARQLIDKNLEELEAARGEAPPEAAPLLDAQIEAYREKKALIDTVAPGAPGAQAIPKGMVDADTGNLGRPAYAPPSAKSEGGAP